MSSPLDQLRGPLADLPDPLPLPFFRRSSRARFEAVVTPPGSKSLTNRAVLLAALATGTSTIRRPLLDADDAQRMVAALRKLGAVIEPAPGELRVTGVGGRWKPTGIESGQSLTLDLNNAGTATRFLAAASMLSPCRVTIDGNARMRERPIAELADVLRTMGMGVRYLGTQGCPPVEFAPPASASAYRASIDIPTTQSSQFISAMLLVAPFLEHGLTVRLTGAVTSASYVEMTIGLLHKLGAVVKTSEDLRVLRVGPSLMSKDGSTHAGAESAGRMGLPAFTYDVEPDASGATYFWAAAAMCPDSLCTVRGLGAGSLQGDTDFPDELGRMGAAVVKLPADERGHPGVSVRGPGRLSPILADLTLMPDAAMTLAAVCAFAPGTSILRGLRTLRVKETDRIAATMNELRKLGVTCINPTAGDPDVMTITPPEGGIDCSPGCPRVEFDTYDDHRMAMSMALIALRRPNVFIKHPQCVAKTYPSFWQDFAGLYDAAAPAR